MFDLNYYDTACNDTTCNDTPWEDLSTDELISASEAEEQACLSEDDPQAGLQDGLYMDGLYKDGIDDIHPYKSRVPQTKGGTVSFPRPLPKLTRFNT